MNHTIHLRAGTLRLSVERAELPLEQLCGFASRRNRKRGFLFVSKVLGKHVPVRPSRMEEVHQRLAEKLWAVPGPVLMIALAETATALGQGVFEAFLHQTGRDDVLFLHTTRYRLARPLALTFDEMHSHATEHLLYRPDDPLFQRARSLVLIDDEISTGRTLLALARAYLAVNPACDPVPYLVSITDWGKADLGAPCQRLSLLRGAFTFEPDEAFDPGPLPVVVGKGDYKDALLPTTGGRFGLRSCLALDPAPHLSKLAVRAGERVLVLGTGEFAYPPYLLARELERRGLDVWYQSTTRSPILVGDAITSAIEFLDNYGDEIPNFVYNVADRPYDRIALGYETHPVPASHSLEQSVLRDAHPLSF